MYYSYVEIEYVATSFSPARTDLALKLLTTCYGKRISRGNVLRSTTKKIAKLHQAATARKCKDSVSDLPFDVVALGHYIGPRLSKYAQTTQDKVDHHTYPSGKRLSRL